MPVKSLQLFTTDVTEGIHTSEVPVKVAVCLVTQLPPIL